MRNNLIIFSKIKWTLFILLTSLLFSTQLLAAPVRFIVAGDSRGPFGGTPTNEEILAEIADATVAENADFILFPGDLVWGYGSMGSLETQLTEWLSIMQPVYDAGIGVYPCRGNHEIPQDDFIGTAWNSIFTGPYALPTNGPEREGGLTYSFAMENIFVVALDQYSEGIETHKVNQTWLDEQFAANTLPHVFVFGHEPAFAIGTQTSLDLNPEERNTFWESIAAEGGRTYFHTHDHLYAHARIDDGDENPYNDVHQFDVATITDSFYDAPKYNGDNAPYTPVDIFHQVETFGYVVVDVDGPHVSITWKARTAPGVYEPGGDVFNYSKGSMQIDKCKVKAGKNGKGDSFQFSGLMDASEANFDEAMGGDIVVTIAAETIPDLAVATFTFPINEASLKKGKYKAPKVKPADKSAPVTALQIDSIKGKIKFSGKNLDLSGLDCPITITIQIGNYSAETVLDEDIVNGPQKPCPPELM